MNGAIVFSIGVLLAAILILAYLRVRRVPKQIVLSHREVEQILTTRVDFFSALKPADKQSFLSRVIFFLSKIKITPVGAARITDEDKVLVAAAGIIPIFRYKNWFYNNLSEVLLYPESFNTDFEPEGGSRNIIGMVGDGAMHRTMIISLPSLRRGFDHDGKTNTAIHEFIHLLDKADGATDGIPELILGDENIRPWVKIMHQYLKTMRRESTDIDPYGATNETEFFAVVSEYFFQQPEKLKEKHPELYAMLEEAFENKGGSVA